MIIIIFSIRYKYYLYQNIYIVLISIFIDKIKEAKTTKNKYGICERCGGMTKQNELKRGRGLCSFCFRELESNYEEYA